MKRIEERMDKQVRADTISRNLYRHEELKGKILRGMTRNKKPKQLALNPFSFPKEGRHHRFQQYPTGQSPWDLPLGDMARRF